MVNKDLISFKKHEDRELAAKTCFETTSIDIETPKTMILLLESKEELVLLKALSSLDKYAGKLEQNAKVLHEGGILKSLIALLEHSNLYIQRFSTKLLAELCFVQSIVNNLFEEHEGVLLIVLKLLQEVNDSFVKEFSASIVAELTKTKVGYDQLIESNMISIIIPLLSLTDPDIQYNSSKILQNIIKDPNDKTVLTEDSSFTIKPFVNLLVSEYVAVQNITLDILYLLTEQTKLNKIPKEFQDAGGVMKLLSIIKNYEWKDIHAKALDVLGNIYNDPNIAQTFLKDGVLQLFTYIDYATDPQLLRRAVEVLAKIAETALGRRVLLDSGYLSRLEGMLSDDNEAVCSTACATIANLCQDVAALRELMALPTVEHLLMILVDKDRSWHARGMALHALYEILKRDSNACTYIADRFEMGFIENVLVEFDENASLQAAVTAANCVTTMAGYGDLREKIINPSLISSLLHCFKDFSEDTSVLKLAVCEALCSLLTEREAQDILHNLDGLSAVWQSITKHPNNVQFLQSAAVFVHLCVSLDKRFTPVLLRLGVLNWLLAQRGLRNDCPAWEMALETVFNHFLPIKFAFTGRLEMLDVTEDCFYITQVSLSRKQLDNNMFPILDDFISDMVCPLWTLYLANFGEQTIQGGTRPTVKSSERTKLSPKPSVKDSRRISLKTSVLSINREKITSPDQYLLKYIDSLKEALHQNGYSSEPSKRHHHVIDEDTIRGKACVIGKFVAKQMSGIETNEACSNHMLDLHINELKVELQDNIIPVGHLRVGLHLERALLFKVLADRVGLPCSLVRGWQRGWVEVCLPCLPPAPRPAFPDSLLKPSHVVDLMLNPGQLLQLHSYEADQYCGLKSY